MANSHCLPKCLHYGKNGKSGTLAALPEQEKEDGCLCTVRANYSCSSIRLFLTEGRTQQGTISIL